MKIVRNIAEGNGKPLTENITATAQVVSKYNKGVIIFYRKGRGICLLWPVVNFLVPPPRADPGFFNGGGQG